jgi:Rod binding domain-containing protein
MDTRLRLSFFCGACFGLAIGGVAGHLLVWNRTETTRVAFYDRLISQDLASKGVGGADLLVPLLEPEVTDIASIPAPQGGVVLNDPDQGDEPVHAEALVEVPAPTGAATPPDNLAVEQAKPIAEIADQAPIASIADSAPAPKAEPQPTDAKPSADFSKLDPEVVKMLNDARAQGYASAVRPRRVSDEISMAVPIMNDDRVLAAVTIRFSGSAVPLKMAVERFLPKLRESAQKIRQTFADQQRDPPHQHHRPTQSR